MNEFSMKNVLKKKKLSDKKRKTFFCEVLQERGKNYSKDAFGLGNLRDGL